MNKSEIKAKWLEELRSGKHLQTKETLKRDLGLRQVGFCCLGVLEEKVLGNYVAHVPEDSGCEGPQETYDKLSDIIGQGFMNIVSGYNDQGWTFPEIADYIEREWKVE